jgi:hypothetical protein
MKHIKLFEQFVNEANWVTSNSKEPQAQIFLDYLKKGIGKTLTYRDLKKIYGRNMTDTKMPKEAEKWLDTNGKFKVLDFTMRYSEDYGTFKISFWSEWNSDVYGTFTGDDTKPDFFKNIELWQSEYKNWDTSLGNEPHPKYKSSPTVMISQDVKSIDDNMFKKLAEVLNLGSLNLKK